MSSSVQHPNVVRTYHFDITPVKMTEAMGRRGLQIVSEMAPLDWKLYLVQVFRLLSDSLGLSDAVACVPRGQSGCSKIRWVPLCMSACYSLCPPATALLPPACPLPNKSAATPACHSLPQPATACRTGSPVPLPATAFLLLPPPQEYCHANLLQPAC